MRSENPTNRAQMSVALSSGGRYVADIDALGQVRILPIIENISIRRSGPVGN